MDDVSQKAESAMYRDSWYTAFLFWNNTITEKNNNYKNCSENSLLKDLEIIQKRYR